MELFIGTVADPERADRLAIAIDGRGAFRRFKDVLGRWPGEIERWYAFSEERQRGRARAWLAGAGYCWRPRCLHMSRQRSVSTARQASMTMAVLSLRP